MMLPLAASVAFAAAKPAKTAPTGASAAVARKAAPGTPRVKAHMRPSVNGVVPEGSGTITYDNNVPFNRNGTLGGTVGNLFTPPVDPHGVASASFRIAGNYGTSMVLSIWDKEPASFMLLHRELVSSLPSSATATMGTAVVPLTMAIVAHSGQLQGGLRNSDYATCNGDVALNSTCDGVALTMGGVDPGMGFHGLKVPFNSTMFVPTVTTVAGTGTSLGTINAIFRITGDNLPVELMKFGVE
ncbi:MAG: hypothetical protein ABI639_00185 [Thermoanaerobaculia bacterium]